MSNDAGTGRPGTLLKRSQVAVIAVAVVSLIAVLLTLSATPGTADAQLSALPAGTTCFSFDESDDGSNALTHDSFLHTVTPASATVAPTLSINGNVENVAVRNDTGEVYAYDAGGNGATDQLYVVDPATGAFSAPADYGLAGLGDVDAMFFVSDEDGNTANDILWVLVDPNVLTGYDINGAVAGGPVTVAVPAGEGIEGATWLAEPAPGEFFIHYTTTGSATVSVLASLGTGTTPGATPSNIGGTEIDVEGFGTDGAGNLYLTTGGDGDNTLYSVTTGATTNAIADLSAVGGNADFESVDCAQPAITLTKTVTAGPTANGDGTFAFEFTFTIENTGHLPLSNVVLTDPYTFTPAGVTATNLISTNDCPAELLINATCTYTDTVDLSAAPATYNNAATVDATGSFGQPVTDVDDVDLVIPAIDDPSLAVVKTVALTAAACPSSFAGGTAGRDAINANIGDTVVYCINVINNGPGDATNVAVQDSLTAVTTSIGNLAANDQDAFSYTYVVAAEPETNTATVSGQNIAGQAVPTASDTAGTDPLAVVDPSLEIVKTVVRAPADCPGTVADGIQDRDALDADIGELVVYCINAVNNGPGVAEDVRITDILAGLDIAVGTLAAGQQTAEVYTHTVGAEPETNTATITGNKTDGTPATPDSDTAGTDPRPPLPDVEIIKSVVLPSQACPADYAAALVNKGAPTDTITASVGDFVKYCINVINNGPGPAFNVTVSDPQDDNSPRDRGNLAAGAETSFLYLRDVLASPSTNVATVTADDSQGNTNVSTDNDDAGVTPQLLGALGNFVWLDTNSNGIQDAGEAGVAGVTVSATGPSGTLTATTDAAGAWSITGLLPGDYTVTFTDPAGRPWTTPEAGDDTNDSDATATGAAGIHAVVGGQTNDTVDAGLVIVDPPLGALGNFIWLDNNQNGIQDAGEPGVAGVTVSATGPSGTLTTTTDAAGAWLIDDLAPGTYTVTFTDPAGRTWTIAEAGDDTNDSDASATGAAGTHVVAADATNDTVDGGLIPPLGGIGNFVWLDSDRDGIQDAGAGVQGVTVSVTGPSGTLTTTTDAAGAWLIEDLLPGDYTVTFTDPLGRDWTVAEAGDDTNDSDAGATGAAGTHAVVADQINDTVDAGLVPPPVPVGALGNFIWLDNNLNGIQDAGEPGVAGVTVTATNAAGVATTTTDAAGAWLIDNLPGGTYTVAFTDPLGRTWTIAEAGDDTNDSDASATGAAGAHVVTVNQTNDTVDGGLIPPLGGIGNFVWLDSDRDGIQDAGAGVQGVTVSVTGPSGTLTTTTDAAGAWLIEDLLPGDYTVTFTDPLGRDWTVAEAGDDTNDSDAGATGAAGTHAVVADQINDTVDAGLVPPPVPVGALGNFIWLDNNANGIQDAGEPGVAGVTVTATGPSGTLTTTTDAAGAWSITDLAEGTYAVTFTDPAGRTWTVAEAGDDTNDSDASATGAAGSHVVVANQTNDTVDGGLIPPLGALGNFIWLDNDRNGIQDAGEPGVAGVTVSATGPSGTLTATTDGAGAWTIANLLPGDYTVTFTDPAGRDWTTAEAGDDTNDSDASATGVAGTHAVVSGQTNDTVDGGLVPPIDPVGALGNFVWLDNNSNGIQDAGEPGVAGVTVTAVGTAGAETTTTDAQGSWTIAGLAPGAYTVSFSDPVGRDWTVAEAGNDTNDSDAGATGAAGTHTVVADQTNDTVDAGLIPVPNPAQLGNRAWIDTNRNGMQDAGEPGVAGVSVVIWSADANGDPDQIVKELTTDANGLYASGSLEPGDYIVQVATPDGHELTTVGTDAASDTDSNIGANGLSSVVTLAGGDSNLTIDVGFVVIPPAQASLGNRVWIDQNGNGIQDAGEPGVPGVEVNIWTVDANGGPGAVVTTVATVADGSYASGALDAGDYIVQFTTPAGHAITTQGTDAASDTDSNVGAGGLTAVVTLAAGDNNITIDAGYVPLGSIGDFIFTDANSNGVQDAGEAPVAGAVVRAYTVDADGTRTLVGSDTSNAAGKYSINNLPAGDYVVNITLPSGLVLTTANAGADDTDSDFSPASGDVAVTLGLGQANITIDAGVVGVPPVQPPMVMPPPYDGPFKVVPNMVMNPFTPIAAVAGPGGTGGGLAHTGSQAPALAAIAIGLLCVGSVLMVGGRRERYGDE